jgi:multiple RNA-binding domain-containing protein 1
LLQVESNAAEDAHPTRKRNMTNDNDALSDSNLKRKRDGENKSQDPKLQEYLSLMGQSSKTRTWANDDDMIKPSADTVPVINQSAQEETQHEELPSHPKKAKTEKPPTVAKPEQPEPMVIDKSEVEETQETPTEDNSAVPEVETAPLSDADWLRSKTSRLLGLLDEDELDEFDQHKTVATAGAPAKVRSRSSSPVVVSPQHDEESRTAAIENIAPNTTDVDNIPEATVEDPNIDLIRASARLFLRNLAYDTTESDLQPIFDRFGKIEEVSTVSLFTPFFFLSPKLDCWVSAYFPRVLV